MTNRNGDAPRRNREAWDELYQKTQGSVWGDDPIPFVEEFVSALAEEFPSDGRFLDAATGEGRHLPALLRLCGEIHAADASPCAIGKLNQIPGDYHAVQTKLEQTPYEDETFDFILLIDTVETLPNVDDVLAELRRILKPGGLLLCNIPGKEDGISEDQMVDAETNGDETYFYQGTYFYRFYEEDQAVDLVVRNGFEVRRNELRTWMEKAHPGFRDYDHSHTSRIFLLSKPVAVRLNGSERHRP